MSERYRVELTRAAEKDLRDLRSYIGRVMRALAQLEGEPRRGHSLSGSLKGVRSLEFSLPGGAHRAVYTVNDDERVCLVFLIGSHEGIYKLAERRFEALKRGGMA